MELLDLQIFLRVAREQSVSRAAAGLHMAQPSVSQRLQGLEREVGRPLFRRHRRGVELTPEGQVLLGYAERALGLLDEGLEAARATAGAVLRINIAAPASINGYFLPPLLRRLADAGCDVTMHDAHSHEVMQQVLDGTIHAGFVLAGPGQPSQPGVQQQVVRRDPILCVAAPDHPLAGRRSLRMADLTGHRVAFYIFSGEAGKLEEELGAATGVSLRGILGVTPAEAARSLAQEGGFITFLPAMTVAASLAEGRLVSLPVADLPPFEWQIALVYRARKALGPEVQTLLRVCAFSPVRA